MSTRNAVLGEVLTDTPISFSQLRLLTGEKDRTLRTWLNRYFPTYGTKNSSGKLEFAGMNCMAIIVFADMVSKMGMQPELAKRIVKEAIKRWVEMLKIQIKAVEKALLPGNENNPITIDDSEAVFLELVSINKDDFDFRRLTRNQLHEGFDKANFDHEDQQARLLIPLDSYYWNGLTKLVISIERQQELEKASSNLKDISDEEVSSRRRKLHGVWYT